jgi:hypothetical protein
MPFDPTKPASGDDLDAVGERRFCRLALAREAADIRPMNAPLYPSGTVSLARGMAVLLLLLTTIAQAQDKPTNAQIHVHPFIAIEFDTVIFPPDDLRIPDELNVTVTGQQIQIAGTKKGGVRAVMGQNTGHHGKVVLMDSKAPQAGTLVATVRYEAGHARYCIVLELANGKIKNEGILVDEDVVYDWSLGNKGSNVVFTVSKQGKPIAAMEMPAREVKGFGFSATVFRSRDKADLTITFPGRTLATTTPAPPPNIAGREDPAAAVAAPAKADNPPAAPENPAAAPDNLDTLAQQAPNAVAWVLAPLDAAVVPDIRQNLTSLREALLDEAARKPAAIPDAYKVGEQLCNAMIGTLDERDRARAHAGFRAVEAQTRTGISSEALEARRTSSPGKRMNWPRFDREQAQRDELKSQAVNKAAVIAERPKLEWTQRADQIRPMLDTLYKQFREALRKSPGRPLTTMAPTTPPVPSGVTKPAKDAEIASMLAGTWHFKWRKGTRNSDFVFKEDGTFTNPKIGYQGTWTIGTNTITMECRDFKPKTIHLPLNPKGTNVDCHDDNSKIEAVKVN